MGNNCCAKPEDLDMPESKADSLRPIQRSPNVGDEVYDIEVKNMLIMLEHYKL